MAWGRRGRVSEGGTVVFIQAKKAFIPDPSGTGVPSKSFKWRNDKLRFRGSNSPLNKNVGARLTLKFSAPRAHYPCALSPSQIQWLCGGPVLAQCPWDLLTLLIPTPPSLRKPQSVISETFFWFTLPLSKFLKIRGMNTLLAFRM